MLLTTEYQLISTIPITYGEIRTYAKYTSQDKTNNYTSYAVKQIYYIPKQSTVSFYTATAKINDFRKDYPYTGNVYTFYKNDNLIQELFLTADHNADGSSKSISIQSYWEASFGGGGTATASISFPRIERYPVITTAKKITDEENPSLSFTNPMSYKVKPYFDIVDGSGNSIILLKRNEYVSSPYNWQITDLEREEIRKKTYNAPLFASKLGLEVYDYLDNYITKVEEWVAFKYVNSGIIVNQKMEELNPKVIDLLGTNNANQVIRNISKLRVSANPIFTKFSRISRINYFYNENDYNGGLEGTIAEFTYLSGHIQIDVKDTREFWQKEYIYPNVIEYKPIQIDFFEFRRLDSTSNKILLTANISYDPITINDKANAPLISYKMGANGEIKLIPESAYVINKELKRIEITDYELPENLVYTDSERFYLNAEDFLSTDSENDIVSQGVPSTEEGEHDFQVNGEFYIADRTGRNEIDVKNKLDKLTPEILEFNGTINAQEEIEYNISADIIKAGMYIVILDYSFDQNIDKDNIIFYRLGDKLINYKITNSRIVSASGIEIMNLVPGNQQIASIKVIPVINSIEWRIKLIKIY